MNRYWKRVAVGAAASALVVALAQGPEPATDPAYGRCSSEDEIPVSVLRDSYKYEAGDMVCVHVDSVFPAGGDPR